MANHTTGKMFEAGCWALLIGLLAAGPAAAQTQSSPQEEEPGNYITVYFARNFGGDLFKDRAKTNGLGVSYTFWAPGPVAAEVDFGYNKEFFGSTKDLGSDSNLLTLTLNGIFGPWIHAGAHSFRPYGVAGGGLMRSQIDKFTILGKDVRNKGVIDAGGGLLYLVNKRVGVRGEVRYFWGVGANDSEAGWGLIDHWTYARGSIGAVIAF